MNHFGWVGPKKTLERNLREVGLDEVVPLENASMPGRVVIQWDKDDCTDMGLIKVDLLGLGMMAVLQDALQLVNTGARGAPALRQAQGTTSEVEHAESNGAAAAEGESSSSDAA